MTPDASDDVSRLAQRLQKVQDELTAFAERFLRKASARIGGRAIGTYMRDAKGEGRRSLTDRGPLRIVTGRLARSLASRGRSGDTGGQPEGIMEIQIAQGVVKLIKGSKVPYAAIHEHGGGGIQQVKAHTREINRSFTRQVEGPADMVSVRAHARDLVIRKRAYLLPGLQQELPTLREMAEKDLLNLVVTGLRGAGGGGASHA